MKAKIIDLPKILDARGNLSVIEELKEIPFYFALNSGYFELISTINK